MYLPTEVNVFALSLTLFHTFEPLLQWMHHPEQTGWDSFLLSNSYIAAQGLAVVEYIVERHFVPSTKGSRLALGAGLALIAAGEGLRKAAIITAGRSFNHRIVQHRETPHKLVTKGVYSIARHPSYLGFLLWALGTQVLLSNPLSFVIFLYVLMRFFRERIAYEEGLLASARFFGDEYRRYMMRVPPLLPWDATGPIR